MSLTSVVFALTTVHMVCCTGAGPLTDTELAQLIRDLLNAQPYSAVWKQLMFRVGGSSATDESIAR